MLTTFRVTTLSTGVRLDVLARGRLIDTQKCVDHADAAHYVAASYQVFGRGVQLPSTCNLKSIAIEADITMGPANAINIANM